MAVGELIVSIIGDMKELSKTFAQVQTEIGNVGTKLSSVGKSMSSAGAGMTAGITAPILAAGAGIALVTKQAVDFEKSMAEVFTLLPNASQSAMDSMTQDVLDFSKEMGILPETVVPALYQSLSAGVPPNNVFDFLTVASKLAIAGATDITTVVDGLTSVVNSYGSDVISAGQASDIMITGMRLGKTTIEELSDSYKNVGSVAASLKIPFGDIVSALAAMTLQGIPTSEATTQLKQLLSELSKEGSVAADRFKELSGKSFPEFIASGGTLDQAIQIMNDGMLKTVPSAEEMGKAMFELSDPTSALALDFQDLTGQTFDDFRKGGGTIEQALEMMGVKFGDTKARVSDYFGSQEAGNAILALSADEGRIYTGVLGEMGNSMGATGAAYATMSETSTQSLNEIKATLASLTIEMGDKFIPILQDTLVPLVTDTLVPALEYIIPIIGSIAEGFNALPQPVKLVILGFIAFIAALGPLLIIIGSVITAVGTISTAFSAFAALFATGGVLAGVAPAMAGVLAAINIPILAIIAVVGLLVVAWTQNWWDIQGKAAAAWAWLKSQANALWQQLEYTWHAIIMSVSTLKQQFGVVWDALKNAYSTISGMIVSVATGLYNGLRNIFNLIISSVSFLLNTWRSNWNIFNSATSSASSTLHSLITSLYNNLRNVFNSIVSAVVSLLNSWRTQWNNIYNLIITAATNIITKVKSIPTAIKSALSVNLSSVGSSFVKSLSDGILNALSTLYNSAVAQVNKIKSAVSGAQASISSSLSSLSSSSASSLGKSLSTAISSAGTKAKVSLAEAASGLKRLLPNSPAKEGPFKELPNWDFIFLDPLTKSINSIRKLSTPLSSALSSVRGPLDSGMSTGLKNVSSVSNSSTNYEGSRYSIGPNYVRNDSDLQAIINAVKSSIADDRRRKGIFS